MRFPTAVTLAALVATALTNVRRAYSLEVDAIAAAAIGAVQSNFGNSATSDCGIDLVANQRKEATGEGHRMLAEEEGNGSDSEVGSSPPPLNNPKALVEVISPPGTHWVGDGFKVHGMFHYGEGARSRSPFLLLDYAQAHHFEPIKRGDTHRRGVGRHPHKGFETVTIAYQGEVQHRDNHGGGGVIGPGDCQWMTAGRGIQHEEFHSDDFSKKGGVMEMMQLWVNLPKRHKAAPPKYQPISNRTVPFVPLRYAGSAAADEVGVQPADGIAAPSSALSASSIAGHARLFAGSLDGFQGPAETFTPMNVWNVFLKPPTPQKEGEARGSKGVHPDVSSLSSVDLPQPEGWTTIIAVLKGRIAVNGVVVEEHNLIHLSNAGSGVRLTPLPQQSRASQTNSDSGDGTDGSYKILFLSGEPFDEPVVGHGPFVMTSQREIQEAFAEFRQGRF